MSIQASFGVREGHFIRFHLEFCDPMKNVPSIKRCPWGIQSSCDMEWYTSCHSKSCVSPLWIREATGSVASEDEAPTGWALGDIFLHVACSGVPSCRGSSFMTHATYDKKINLQLVQVLSWEAGWTDFKSRVRCYIAVSFWLDMTIATLSQKKWSHWHSLLWGRAWEGSWDSWGPLDKIHDTHRWSQDCHMTASFPKVTQAPKINLNSQPGLELNPFFHASVSCVGE